MRLSNVAERPKQRQRYEIPFSHAVVHSFRVSHLKATMAYNVSGLVTRHEKGVVSNAIHDRAVACPPAQAIAVRSLRKSGGEGAQRTKHLPVVRRCGLRPSRQSYASRDHFYDFSRKGWRTSWTWPRRA